MTTFRRAFVRAFVIEGAALTVAIAWLWRKETR